jgi:hypothetical protein
MVKTLTHFNKLTVGYVIQNYVTLPNGTTVCNGQEFVASDEVEYENDTGEHVDDMIDTDKEVCCPFNMVQPMHMPQLPLPFSNPIKESYENGICPDCSSDIPDDVVHEASCVNCDHVFSMPDYEDDQ